MRGTTFGNPPQAPEHGSGMSTEIEEQQVLTKILNKDKNRFDKFPYGRS